jgi:outer membrane biosynthesis protein TonB
MQGPTPQQMAIQKTQEIVAQRQQPQPQPQARTPQPKPAPKPTPAVKGLRSSAEVRKELDMVSRQSDSLYSEGLESGVKYGTPEGESRQAQLGQLYTKTRMLEQELEQVLKAEKTASKKKAPSNVSQMLTEDMVFDTKAEWDKANLLNTLADKKPIGGYRVGNGIVRHEVQDYSSVPEALRSQLPKISIVKRTPKGKRITE